VSSGADTPRDSIMTAPEILQMASHSIAERARQRDHETGERSISRAVAMLNELRTPVTPGKQEYMTDREGWIFMALLKLSRAQGGAHHIDDYLDAAAYIALAGECAEKQQDMPY
jgi:hypothetical protein